MSLVDFDPKKRTEITTPRSRRALLNLGLSVSDLYYPTREELLAQGVQSQFRDDIEFYLDLKEKHVQERVDRFLGQAVKERGSLDETQEQHSSGSNVQMSHSFMQKQEQMLRTLQNKQQIEIEREIQQELRLEQLKKKNEHKEKRLRELKQQQELDFERRMQEKEQKLRLREQKLKQAMEQADRQNASIMQRFQEEEMKIKMKQEKYAFMKQKEKEQRERQFQEKMERRAKKMSQQQQLIELENQNRQMEYEKRLQNLESQMQERQQQLKQKNHEIEQRAKQKYHNATQIRHNAIRRLEDQIHTKEVESQMRTTLMEQERCQQVEKKRQQEQQKQQQMNDKKSSMELENMRRHQNYFNHEAERELKKRLLDQKLRDERIDQSKVNQSRLEEVQMKQRHLQQQSDHQKEQMLQQKMALTKVADERRSRHLQQMKRRCIIELLKLEDAHQNYLIQKRKDELRNAQVIERLEDADRRYKQIQVEQQKLQETKRQMELKMESEKSKILADFDKKKAQYLEEHNSEPAARTSSIIKPSTERIKKEGKNQKTNSVTSFHLPQTAQVQEPRSEKNKPFPEARSSVNLKGGFPTSENLKQSFATPIRRQYFISEDTFKAVQLYANDDTLKKVLALIKKMKISVRPKRKKTTPK